MELIINIILFSYFLALVARQSAVLSFATQYAMLHPVESGERSVLTLGFLSLSGWMQREVEKKKYVGKFRRKYMYRS